MEQFGNIREFSKGHSKEERDELARDISGTRKAHFENVKEAESEKRDFFGDVFENEKTASQLIAKIYDISDERQDVLKSFSKKHSAEERKETARAIREERAVYFQEKKERMDELSQFQGELIGLREKVQSLEEHILSTQSRIEEARNSLFNKMLLRIGIQPSSITRVESAQEQLLSQKMEQEIQAGVLEEEIKKLEVLLEKRHASRITSERLDFFYKDQMGKWASDIDVRLHPERKAVIDEDARTSIEQFYQHEQEKFEAYERDEGARSVKNVMVSQNVFFMHGINTDFVPEDNSLLKGGVSWETKLKILLAFDPTLSVSTIRKGDTLRNMWSGVGVLLKGGRIEDAFSQDAGTKAQGISRRSINYGRADSGDINKKIDDSIRSTDRTYNEFVVSTPEVAGLYVEEEWFKDRRQILPDIIRILEEVKMPLYVVRRGEVFEGEVIDGSLEIHSKRSVTEIVEASWQVSGEIREKLITEIFDVNPFKIKSPELYVLDTERTGAQFYELLEFFKNKYRLWGSSPKLIFKRPPVGIGFDMADGTPFVQGPRVSGIEYEADIILTEQGVYARTFREGSLGPVVVRLWDNFQKDALRLEFGAPLAISAFQEGHNMKLSADRSTSTLHGMCTSIEEYFSLAEQNIKQYEKWREEAKSKLRDTELYDGWLQGMAAHLYGFGRVARERGDKEGADRAFALASRIFSYSEIEDIKTRRLSPDGKKFLVTREDIE